MTLLWQNSASNLKLLGNWIPSGTQPLLLNFMTIWVLKQCLWEESMRATMLNGLRIKIYSSFGPHSRRMRFSHTFYSLGINRQTQIMMLPGFLIGSINHVGSSLQTSLL